MELRDFPALHIAFNKKRRYSYFVAEQKRPIGCLAFAAVGWVGLMGIIIWKFGLAIALGFPMGIAIILMWLSWRVFSHQLIYEFSPRQIKIRYKGKEKIIAMQKNQGIILTLKPSQSMNTRFYWTVELDLGKGEYFKMLHGVDGQAALEFAQSVSGVTGNEVVFALFNPKRPIIKAASSKASRSNE